MLNVLLKSQPIINKEERAIIFLKFVSPQIRIRDSLTFKITTLLRLSSPNWLNKKNGASFCNLLNNKNLFQDNSSLKFNNHPWKGAAPIFNSKLNLNIKFIILLLFTMGLKILNKKKLEAKLWIKKYLRFNLQKFASLKVNITTNNNKLISKATQKENSWVALNNKKKLKIYKIKLQKVKKLFQIWSDNKL